MRLKDLCCFSICFVFSLSSILGQHLFQIQGSIYNDETKDTLVGVNVYPVDAPTTGAYTDENGFFQLEINQLPIAIRFSYIGFHDQTILITDASKTVFDVSLRPAVTTLPEVTISSEVIIDTIFNEPYAVSDYEFHEDFILLLAYKNMFDKYSLLILDQNRKVIFDQSLKTFDPVSLFKDCLGKVYLIGEIYTYEIKLDSLATSFENKIASQFFEEEMKTCVSSSDNFMYFSKYYFQGQALQYHAIPKLETGARKRLPIIQHENNIGLLMEETGTRFPRSGDVWQRDVSESLEELRELDYQLRGMMKIFYPKINAPLITKDSFVYIFNHTDHHLQLIKETGESLYTIPITYHQSRKWKKEVLFDQRTNRTFTFFNTKKGEAVREIYLEDGTLGPAIPLDRPFIKNRKVHGGYLYFLYKNVYVGERNLKLHRIEL